MAGFKQLSGLVVPLDAANVDTDAIIPKQFLQAVTRVGFGKHLFHEWRYLDVEGTNPNPAFVLNYPQYQGATILLARKNLGCGSSREHAPWALTDYGFKVMIAPSFADIFYNNSLNNHMLPIRLSEEEVEEIFQWVWANEGKQIHVDLEAMTVTVVQGGGRQGPSSRSARPEELSKERLKKPTPHHEVMRGGLGRCRRHSRTYPPATRTRNEPMQ